MTSQMNGHLNVTDLDKPLMIRVGDGRDPDQVSGKLISVRHKVDKNGKKTTRVTLELANGQRVRLSVDPQGVPEPR